MRFATLPQQQEATQRLRQLVQEGRLPHAQLLVGPQGGDQLALALAFATYLLCPMRTSEDACGDCTSCQQAGKHGHPDLYFTFPTGAGATPASLLPRWRTFLGSYPASDLTAWSSVLESTSKRLQIGRLSADDLRKEIPKPPHQGTRKIFLLWLPERLHPTAANALLKTFEEPPAHAHLLLVTNEVERVLPTLRSRTWQLTLSPTVRPWGSDAGKQAHFQRLQAYFRKAYQQDVAGLSLQAEQFHKLTTTVQQEWVAYSLAMVEHLLWHTFGKLPLRASLSEEEQTFITKLGEILTLAQVKRLAGYLGSLHQVLARHAHPRLAYLSVGLRLSEILVPHKLP